MKALNPFAPFWYTPKVDAEEEHPTKFKLRGLDGAQLGYISPEFIIDQQERLVTGLSGKGLEVALQHGLVDWENFENDAGKVAFSKGNFGLIPFEVRAELAMQIIAASYPSPAEKKT